MVAEKSTKAAPFQPSRPDQQVFIDDAEFATRLGAERQELRKLLGIWDR